MSARDHLHKFRNVKRGGGGWVALCPAHDDERNSLSISDGNDGRLLLFCHAGCTYESICIAAGIAAERDRPPVIAYDYRDGRGDLIFQVVRKQPKGFFQRRPDGSGGWVNSLGDVRRVLYRLRDLLAAAPDQTVFVTEGEKDADRLASLGLVATTNVGGAGKWRDEYGPVLRGRSVVVIPDNDEPGRKHDDQVARSLLGIAASVRILDLPDLPPKGDVSDWLDAGGTAERLQGLAKDAPEYAVGDTRKQVDDAPLRIVRMTDVEPEEVRWLWHPYIPLGKQTLIDGDPGIGKSTMLCAVASAVSNGRGLPGVDPFEPGNVLMLSAEDGLGDTLRPRLDAVGANVSRIFALNEPLTFDAAGLLRLEAAIIEHSPLLVIVDPLFAYTGGKADIHRANECRAISAPLAAIAERQGCAIVAVRHLGKSRGGGHALNAGIGSIDFAAAARSVLLVGQDPDEPSRRAIVHVKSNLAPLGDSIGYALEGGQFYWTGVSDLTAGRILAGAQDEEERSSAAEAVDFLKTALCDGGRDAKAIETEARQAGISPVTLRRAKGLLKIRSHKVGMPGSHYQKWVWELPDAEDDQTAPEGDQENRIDHLRASDAPKETYANNLPGGDQVFDFDHLRGGVDHLRGEEMEEVTV